MLNQDVLLNSHEAGVGALWLEFLNGSISLLWYCIWGIVVGGHDA
ncbi:hypothetical protein Yangon188_08880 [Helicobacter pylori]